MLTFENFLSEETSKMTRGVGGWTSVTNAAITHSVRFASWTETVDSDVQGNSIKITATGGGDSEVVTEQFNIEVGTFYKTFEWVYGSTMPTTECGTRYYSVDGTMLQDTETQFLPMRDDSWNGIWHISQAPENAVLCETYTRFDSMVLDQEVFISRPSVMQQSKITPDFVDYALYHIPDYMIEADLAQTSNDIGAPTPLVRYTVVGSKQMSDTMEDVISWDYVHPTFAPSGTADYSSLADPFKAEAEWLPWLAQTMGVSLDTIPSGGRSPWVAFESAGIDLWTEWEEDVDIGSIPGVPDTEWVDIESYSPDYFDTDTARRLQIASGFNGVLGGTSESITRYVAALLNTEQDDPFVYVVKHYATNPYRILVATLGTEDPDPNGDMLKTAIEAAAPAGTSVTTKHGVSVTARTYYSIPEMYYNMWTDIDRGGDILPVRFVENNAANGRNIALASISGTTDPYLGGGVALARWYPGFAFYSGALGVSTATLSAYNILGDIDIRVLLSNVTIPSVGTLELASSPNKWTLSVDTTGSLVLDWEFTGTNTITSTLPVNWGNEDKGPFWVRATLDINNDAAGHDVVFYTSPTLYEDDWSQVGTTVTTAGTSGIDSATASMTLLGNGTNPVDGVSAIIYRLMVHDENGTAVVDINTIGEPDFANTLINTGTSYFNLPITNITVSVNPAASGATNLTESAWTAQAHKGHDDYFYLGKSPYKYDTGNSTGLGDTLVASSLPSDTYDWTITLIDGGTLTGSTGAVTSITWDTDTYGGESVLNIAVRESTGQTVKGFFTPDLLQSDITSNTDIYATDWTINRTWDVSAFYEYSAFVDRDYVSPTYDDGSFNSGITFDAEETLTVAVAVRRFWSSAVTANIVDHTTTSGWSIGYSGPLIQASITDGTSTTTLSYDEVANGTLGDFSLVTLRRDVGAKTVSLWINDIQVDSAADPFVDGGLFATTGSVGNVGNPPGSMGFDLRYFGIFDRALSDADIGFLSGEMASLVFVLPQAAKAVVPDLLLSTPTIHTPGFDLLPWNIVIPATIDASPTLYAPTFGIFAIPDYIPTAYTIYAPTMAITVHPATLDASATLYDFTSTGGA